MRFSIAALALSLSGCALVQVPSEPKLLAMPPIHSVAAWGGTPQSPASAAIGAGQTISRITLHHQGETWPRPGASAEPGDEAAETAEAAEVARYLQRLQSWSRLSKRWVDIPYHYVIAPSGAVYAGRTEAVAGDTNTEYRPEGHVLVMLLGNFEDIAPTPAQLQASVALMAWLAQQHGLSAAAIASHRDFSSQTVCPGKHLYRYIENGWLQAAVAARLAGRPAPALPD